MRGKLASQNNYFGSFLISALTKLASSCLIQQQTSISLYPFRGTADQWENEIEENNRYISLILCCEMGLKKVFNLRRLRGINSGGVVEEVEEEVDSDASKADKQERSNEDNEEEMFTPKVTPVESVEELAIVLLHDEQESVYSKHLVHDILPIETADEPTKKEYDGEVRGAYLIENNGKPSERDVQVYEFVDTNKDDGSTTNYSLMGVISDENTAFEVLTICSSKDYGSIFSGVDDNSEGSIKIVGSSYSSDDTAACGSLITPSEGDLSVSDESDRAIGSEVVLAKNQSTNERHNLRRFFSIMSLIEDKTTIDESDLATTSKATMETNSLAYDTTSTSSETDDGTESSSVAIARFGQKKVTTRSRRSVLAPSASAANRDSKKKIVAIVIDNFKQLAGKGACFCNDLNDTAVAQNEVNINGVFSRDVDDNLDDIISCALIDHDDSFTLDSMTNATRMYD